jgi:iron complex transport system ATP-binding protein
MSRVLAQIWETDSERKILFLDEPVSHLDMKYQHQLLEVAKNLCKNNVTVIAILHDINLALAFADRIIFMKSARVVSETVRMSEIDADLIERVFDVRSRVIDVDGNPIVVF